MGGFGLDGKDTPGKLLGVWCTKRVGEEETQMGGYQSGLSQKKRALEGASITV